MRIPWNRSLGRSRARRGGVLVLALMAVMSVSVLAAGFLQLSLAATRSQSASLDGKRAFYAAEAGLAEGYSGLSVGGTGKVGSQAQPARFGDGLFWVESERDEASGMVVLQSTGMVGTGRARLEIAVEPRRQSVATLGVFSRGALTVQGGSVIDGFDSKMGSYVSQVVPASIPAHTAGGARIGSNQGIVVNGGAAGTVVYGRAEYGIAYTCTLGPRAQITEGKLTRRLDELLPPVVVPPLSLQSAVVCSSPTPMLIDGVSVGYAGITVKANSQLIVRGPATVVLGSFDLEKDAQLTLDTSAGAVHVYVTGAVAMAAGSVLAVPHTDPTRLSLQVSAVGGTKVVLNAKSSFYGAVYAPQTGIAMAKDFELYGTAIGDTLTLASGARLHVDTALSTATGASTLPTMLCWAIIDLPAAVAGDHSDPFDVLGVNPATLPRPANAHEDIFLELTYVDQFSVTTTYSGWKSALNVANVNKALSFKTYTADPGGGGIPLN